MVDSLGDFFEHRPYTGNDVTISGMISYLIGRCCQYIVPNIIPDIGINIVPDVIPDIMSKTHDLVTNYPIPYMISGLLIWLPFLDGRDIGFFILISVQNTGYRA